MSEVEAPKRAHAIDQAHSKRIVGPLKFNGDNAFQRELRRRVDEDFRRRGCDTRDSGQMYLKTGVILATFVLTYVALVFFATAWWQALPLSIVLGVATAGIGFNVMHDGGHMAYSRRRWVNRLMASTLDVIGGSSYIWQWKHARFHHTWTNIDGHDSDIDLGVLARLSPRQRWRPWHRWQHIYLWVLYAVTALRWHLYGDFRDMLTGTIGERPFTRPRGWDLAVFIGGKLAFFTLAFGLPLAFHRWTVVVLCYALVTAVTGLLLALVFQMAHLVEQAAFPVPARPEPHIESSWAEHQLHTTVDFAIHNRVLSWLIGGLNFQVEHHLFPRICHVHYPAVERVVASTCREWGLPHHVSPSFGASIASHYRWLRTLSRRPDTPAPPQPPLAHTA
jgi:linoleoyl-CoA desaturase